MTNWNINKVLHNKSFFILKKIPLDDWRVRLHRKRRLHPRPPRFPPNRKPRSYARNQRQVRHCYIIYFFCIKLFIVKILDGTTPSTAKCTPGSIYRLNPQCTSAVLCRYGFTEIVECPSGFAYDSVTDKCLLPHLAKC